MRADRLSPLQALQAQFERWHVPVLVGLLATALTLLVSEALAMREREQFRLLAETGARRVRAEIRAGLDTRIHAMTILAGEWEDRFLRMRRSWESDVRLILSQSAGLESIAWIEPSGRIRWEYPRTRMLPPIDLRPLLAQRSPAAVVKGPTVARDGRARLRILAPLVGERKVRGWLVATFESQQLFADILSTVQTAYGVEISAGRTQLFRGRAAEPPDPAREVAGEVALPLVHTTLGLPGGREIRIGVAPTAAMYAATHSGLPAATRAGGLALSALLVAAFGLRNIAAQRARDLQSEVGERTRAEAEIRRLNAGLEDRVRLRTAELSQSNEDLQRFASFLSHELRQPLGTQLIWIEMLESESASALDESARRQLANIRAGARRMSDLISAQLALSSPRSGEDADERVELAAVVRDAITDLSPTLDAVGTKVDVGLLPTVRGDARQLYELFRNLLENAIKYRREDVATEIRIRLGASAEGRCEVVVEDNGRGFADEDAARIFEPRQRLDATAEGAGLGLAICKKIAERHGGSLSAEGRPGAGATFRICFPDERVCL